MSTKKTVFKGAATALITPFDKSGHIDYGKFAELIEFQIEAGINALVVAGTTGLHPTLRRERIAWDFVLHQGAASTEYLSYFKKP